MTADDYWKKFAGPEGMGFKEFEAAYRHSDGNVSHDTINKAWK